MPKATDLKDVMELVRPQERPFQTELYFLSPTNFAWSLEAGDAQNIQPYIDRYAIGTNKMHNSCGGTAALIRDQLLGGDWDKTFDTLGESHSSTTSGAEAWDWLEHNLFPRDGYYSLTLGCHAFVLAVFADEVAIYQSYMVMDGTGYNLTDWLMNGQVCWNKATFCNHLQTVLTSDVQSTQQQAAATIFQGTCDPGANANSLGNHISLIVYTHTSDTPSQEFLTQHILNLVIERNQLWQSIADKTVLQVRNANL